MPLNTEALQEAVDELKQRIEDDTKTVEMIERLIAHSVDATPAKAARAPRAAKNGGVKR